MRISVPRLGCRYLTDGRWRRASARGGACYAELLPAEQQQPNVCREAEMSLWESATTPSSPRARAAEAAAGSVTKTWSRGGRSREARQREAPAVEGYLEKWSDSRQRFVRVWAALRMDLDGRSPSLVYAVGDNGGAATTPRSILKVSGRHTSPERGSIPVDEIGDVRMGFATAPVNVMDTSNPNCEFQLTLSAPEGAKMILLRSATKAECQSWVAALGIARGSSWRKHQAESALPPRTGVVGRTTMRRLVVRGVGSIQRRGDQVLN